jgi:hypothetical protein
VPQVAPSGFAQVPLVVALQLRPAPQLAVAQQTPSTQLPLMQAAGSVQAVPLAPLVKQVELVVSQ